MLVKAKAHMDGRHHWFEVEHINVPRMIDVNGTKYYLINRNRYLEIIDKTEVKIIVEVTENGGVQAVLTDWLNFHNIAWNLIPEKQEVPKDENSSKITDLPP